jgi:hypothetical protein
MRTVDRLGLGGRIPPGIEQEAVVGFGEVQAKASGLEADQEDGVRAFLELGDDAVASACTAVEVQ